MTDQTSFANILDAPSSGKVERPKPLPVGTYTCVIRGLPRYDKSPKKGTPFVEFSLHYLEAGEDVDEEALAEALTKPSGERSLLTDKSIKLTFYLTEDAMWRLQKFLIEDLEIELEGRTTRQGIDDTPGQQVLVHIKHRASEDGQAVFAEVGSTAKVG